MVDSVSNAKKSREIGPARSRSQVSSRGRDGGEAPATNPDRPVEQAGQSAKPRHYLSETEGLIVDTEA